MAGAFFPAAAGWVSSAAGFLGLSFLAALPVWALAWAGARVHGWLQYRFGLSWAQAALAALYLVTAAVVGALYLAPLALAMASTDLGTVPPYFRLSLWESALFWLASLLRVALVAAAVSALAAPFLVAGEALQEGLRARLKKGPWPRFLAVWACTAAAFFVALFVFPGLPMGLVYLVWFAG